MIVPQIKSLCSFTKWEGSNKEKESRQIMVLHGSKNQLRSKTSSSYFQSEILQVLKEKTVATLVDLEGFQSAALFGVLTWEWPLRRRMICSRHKIYCKSYTSQSWTSWNTNVVRKQWQVSKLRIDNTCWQTKHPQFFSKDQLLKTQDLQKSYLHLVWSSTSTPSFFPAGNNQTSSMSSEGGPDVHHGCASGPGSRADGEKSGQLDWCRIYGGFRK